MTREIEKKIPAFYKTGHCLRIPDIRQIDRHPVLDIMNIKTVSPVFRNRAVHQRDPFPKAEKPPARQRQADRIQGRQ